MNDKNKFLENIANSIHAANKIQDVYKSTLHQDLKTSVKPDKFSILNQVLCIIANYYPGTHKNDIRNALNKTNEYSNTYRNLKRHFKTMRNHRMDEELLIRTLKVVKPVVDNRKKSIIDKTLRIYEVLNS